MCCDVDACSSRTILQFIVLISLSINGIWIFMYYTIGCTWTYVKIDGSSDCMHGPGIQSSHRSIVVISSTDLGMLTHQQALCILSAEYAIRLPESACNLGAWTYMPVSARCGTTQYVL